MRKVLTYLPHAFNVCVLLLTIAYALWFVSDGKFPHFDPLYNHFTDLSRAFLKGQVSLLQQPDPRLATFKDPHDIIYSKIPFLWDTSYFNGKYYIYWGPVPAIYYMVWTSMVPTPTPDELGALCPFIGICIVFVLLLYMVRKQYYPHAPVFTIGLFTLAAALNPPFILMLARPMTYEISILNGQFFLLLGFFFLFRYLTGHRGWMLIPSGLFMGFSVLSRYNLLISVLVFLMLAVRSIWLSSAEKEILFWKRRQPLGNTIMLLTPLLACFIFNLWYDNARFGNPLETGLRYQITNAVPGDRYYSSTYVTTNTYLYLLLPTPVTSKFPYLSIHPFKSVDLPAWAAAMPGKQFDMDFLGLLNSTAILWFELGSVLALAFLLFRRARHRYPVVPPKRGLVAQLIFVFLTAGLLQMVFLLFYYYSAVRFLGDFYLLILTAGFLVWWEIDQLLGKHVFPRAVFWGSFFILFYSHYWLEFSADLRYTHIYFLKPTLPYIDP